MSTTNKSWIGNAIAAVVGIFHKAETIADSLIQEADDFANTIKKIEESSAVQFLEQGIETFFPASTGLINAARLWLGKLSDVLTNSSAEVVKTDAQKLTDLTTYLNKVKAVDEVTYSGLLTTINAGYQQFKANNTGVTGLTTPMSLAAAPVAHDPTLGTAV